MAKPLILSIGANGRFASLVVPELVQRGARVRGFVRSPEKAGRARTMGAEEVVVGDLRNPASLDAALKDADGIFISRPPLHPTRFN